MGSFNATCIVSNLPIEAGTPVRFLALTRSAYNEGNEHICYVGGRWQLRGAPIKAEYNDYGTIENWEKSVTTKLFFKSLDSDAVEKGVGDNQCHDVHVREGMSEDEWLDALWEGRVEVVDYGRRTKSDKPFVVKDEHVRKGVPTIHRIEKIIVDAGFKNTTEYNGAGYTVDDVIYGFVRVRYGRHHTDSVELEKLVPFIQKAGYAAMVTCGSGYYSNHSEILVAPMPGVDERGISQSSFGLAGREDHHKPRPVSLAMIREDVWQILLNTPLKTWRGEWNFAKMKEDALKAVDEHFEREEKIKAAKPEDKMRLIFRDYDDYNRDNLFTSATSPYEGESGFTLRAAFKFALEQNLPKEVLQQYVVDLAETAYVQLVYSHLHGQWHPTTNSGQDGNWKEHRDFLQKLQGIKGKWEDEEDYEEEEDDEEDDEEVE
jgi:hypothetical protein